MAKNNNTPNQIFVSPAQYEKLKALYSDQYAEMTKPSPFLQAVKKSESQSGLASGIALQAAYAYPAAGDDKYVVVDAIDQLQKSITVNAQKAADPKWWVSPTKTPYYYTSTPYYYASGGYSFSGINSWLPNTKFCMSGYGCVLVPNHEGDCLDHDNKAHHAFRRGDIVANKHANSGWTLGEVLEVSMHYAIFAILIPTEKQDMAHTEHLANLIHVPHTEAK